MEVRLHNRRGEFCDICHKPDASYKCPKCGVLYCSKECYHNHNTKCLEQFANELMSEIKPNKQTGESVLNMEKKLLDINLNKIYDEVEPWTAWWESMVITNAPNPSFDPPEKYSENLIYHLINIIYSYCYTMRLYNGDVLHDFIGAARVMSTISSILSDFCDFNCVKESLCSCIHNSRNPEVFVEYQWQIEVIHDVELCVRTQSHIKRCLSESIAIFKEAGQKRIRKKLEFFFAWCVLLKKELLEKLQNEVHEYYTSMNAYLADVYSKT